MDIACVIPVYNNASTVLQVAAGCKKFLPRVIIVDDGSSDLPENFAAAVQSLGVEMLRHSRNLGKGAALKTALAYLAGQQTTYMITIDADGQHLPQDLPAFLDELHADGRNADLLLVGVRDFTAPNIPASSRFGRNFSNFWIKLETGLDCQDTQSGFRAYPVQAINRLKLRCTRYNFEIEVLVRCLWGGVRLREIPIRVIYDPPEKRISHFRPFLDNLRLSLLHASLLTNRLLCLPHRRIVDTPPTRSAMPSLWREPGKFCLFLLRENATPLLLGLSAGVSTFLAILPLLACHMLVILYVCCRLRLNKVMALSIQNLFMPPLTPFLCIELGYYLRQGEFLHELSLQTVVCELHLRFWEWLLGSLIIAPVAAVLVGLIVYVLANCCHKSKEETTNASGAA
ncbi:MAG: DUF2062 domain-containing protein [Oligosphaeraceae bacterium]|nr:DUF2062 domain-containing protein [Oligosphaeraceae bacterium]